MRASVTGKELIDAITRQVVPSGSVAVWWLGQSSLVLKAAGEIIYVDPYLAESPRRIVPPAFTPEQVLNADLVLCTHDHGDHIDPKALPGIAAASPQARFVVPRPAVQRTVELVGDAGRVIGAAVDEPLVLGPVEIHSIPAKHEEFDLHPTLGHPFLGYILRFDQLTIYNAGDSIPFEGLVERLQPYAPHLAFLPINGRDFFRTRVGTLGNFDFREAAELAAAIGVETVVPVHYGMFAGNTVPPGHFISYLADNHPTVQAHVMGRYRHFIYTPPDRA